MNIQDFETYTEQELKSIKVNNKRTESMTIPYSCEHVKDKRFKRVLINDNDVFVLSTQKKKPVHHFKIGQEIELQGPFFETVAQCIGHIDFMHKGFRMQGYFFQWK
ncbi:hypothetical protein ACPCYW_17070 [Klebsiella aerogenes]